MRKDKVEDREILEQFDKGASFAEKAFVSLVGKYGQQLYWQIRRVVKNHDQANDILQNVFVKVWQFLGDFNRDSSLYTWLYRIARNETLNFLQSEKRSSTVDLDDEMLEIKAGHALLDQHTPEQISELLMQAVETLPEKQALVFQLKYFEDLPYHEIAAQLGTSEGALKASYHHATGKIRKFLEAQLNL